MSNKDNSEKNQNKDQMSQNDNRNGSELNGNINNQEELTLSKLLAESPATKKSDIFYGAQSGNSIGFMSFVRENLFLTPHTLNNSVVNNETKLNRPPALTPWSDNDLMKTKNTNGIETLLQSVGADFYELINRDMLNGNNNNIGDFGLTASLLFDPQGGNNNAFNELRDISYRLKDSTNLLNSSFIHNEYEKEIRKQREKMEELHKQQEEKAQQEKLKQQNNQKSNGQGEGASLDEQNGDQDSENGNDNEQKIKEGCRCKNSKCLKLYCECFAKGAFCSDICKCLSCCNKEGFENEIKEAKKATLTRNPDAFTSKLEVVGTLAQDEDIDVNKGMLGYKKGCKCKKTFCKKKYCECFNAGVKCSYLCICENCHNQEDDPNNKEKDSDVAAEQISHKNPNYAGGVAGINSQQQNNKDGKVSSDQSLEYNFQQHSTAKKKIKTNQQDDQEVYENHQLSTDEKNEKIGIFQFTPNFSLHDKSLHPNSLLKNIQYRDFNYNS